MPFTIVRNDITKMQVDAVVNAANEQLLPGGGVCGAIFAAAGYDILNRACRKIGHCDTGNSVITKGYGLDARYIIHTVGPVYAGGTHNEEQLLYSCYKTALELAKKKKLSSVAFPLISSGIYGYPKKEALQVATSAILKFLTDHEMKVYLVVYDKQSFEVSSKLFSSVKAYIDSQLVREDDRRRRQFEYTSSMPLPGATWKEDTGSWRFERTSSMPPSPCACPQKTFDVQDVFFENLLKNQDKSFSERLLELIDQSGKTDAEIYKKANIDRKLFSKIRNNRLYKPSKITAVAFALALELDMKDMRDLVEKAGYSLTHSNPFDIIIEYFVIHRNYNVFEINEILFKFDQPLIGA